MRKWINKGLNTYLNYKSFKSKKRFVIIESDDWGSLRTQDIASLNQLNKISNAVKKDRYTQLDSIASQEDLQALFEVLQSVKDQKGNPACLTANVCTANPDFEAIKACNYEEFSYHPFTKTLSDYSKDIDLFEIWLEGKYNKVFVPQLHGREHLHALAWLKELKAGNKDLLKAFELNTWGVPYTAKLNQRRKNLQAALDIYGIEGEKDYHLQWITDAAKIFKQHFDKSATSFIAPAYIWHSNHHAALVDAKIKTLQGIKLQYEPKTPTKGYNKKLHYIGKTDTNQELIFAPRNAFFEPHSAPHKDWVDVCLKKVKDAFENQKPAIISSHRINFVGRLNTKHRDFNLKILRELLKRIVKKYPDVEFIDSGSLYTYIKS